MKRSLEQDGVAMVLRNRELAGIVIEPGYGDREYLFYPVRQGPANAGYLCDFRRDGW